MGHVALNRNRLDEAEAAFTRMGSIYRTVHNGTHYLVATADSNLGSVLLARKDLGRAEALFRGAIRMYTDTLSADHLNTGIGHLKLGRALLRQARYREAESELLTGHGIVSRQTSPSVSWLQAAREDLVALYEATHRPDQAAKYRATPASD